MEVIVRETKQGKFAQEVVVGDHVLMADEPAALGGNDLGPSPYEFLLIALGACTSMTLRLYANMKKIPLEGVIVKLKHDNVHAEDCVNCEDNRSKIDRIERNITVQGNLTQEQRDKLLEIANKCPVHRSLTAQMLIETRLE